MNLFKEKVHQQMEIAEELLYLYAEKEKKKKMMDFLASMNIEESAEHIGYQLRELDQKLKHVQEMFDKRMNEVIESYHTKPDL
ncbi:YgaB family protein [Jeotgalibacillus sp. R-1-5s-1]|uniref:YgaB family protein n=1 Tax=Jeotgalibacillus sp. R-1-5s-1 TaxID=2555897 RepID=UPI00106B11A2|nr:YgaB family protein [Jeotgalibacillus sp. R-1-5s-1]TFE01248.1 hypothetical protein E2491_04345 [Jeotgalibacillus sp. R-1-5s-1]